MRFHPELLPGTLLRRYKRFLADVALDDGRRVTVHCANPGSMLNVAVQGRPVLLSDSENAARKLRYTWEMIHLGRSWVGVNTALPNALVAEAVRKGRIAELKGYEDLRREVPYGKSSRIDMLLSSRRRQNCYVEVKSVTMAEDGMAAFPDSVTERGQKHLEELMRVRRNRQRAVLLFWVFRRDCDAVRPADEIDPVYGKLLRKAAGRGVQILAYDANVTRRGVTARRRLPVVL